jgi:hypothetical protein
MPSRYSSISRSRVSVAAKSALPKISRFFPSSAFIRATSSAAFWRTRRALFQSADCSVVEKTTLEMSFSRPASSLVCADQYSAKPSYVLRPSRSASAARSSSMPYASHASSARCQSSTCHPSPGPSK